jgi:hypothetical protein
MAVLDGAAARAVVAEGRRDASARENAAEPRQEPARDIVVPATSPVTDAGPVSGGVSYRITVSGMIRLAADGPAFDGRPAPGWAGLHYAVLGSCVDNSEVWDRREVLPVNETALVPPETGRLCLLIPDGPSPGPGGLYHGDNSGRFMVRIHERPSTAVRGEALPITAAGSRPAPPVNGGDE